MTMIGPKREEETLGEIRERVTRITGRRVPDWWAKEFPAGEKVGEGTPVAKTPETGEEDGDS
jgi:hypothetical protein